MEAEKERCAWCLKTPLYRDYHDLEWGKPVRDDAKMFEFLILETFQAGLSWLTILNKREHFRTAFDQFDVQKVAAYEHDKIMELLENPAIIRNKLKIYAAITNAQAYIRVQQEFGTFCNYLWGFVNHKPIENEFTSLKQIPAKTALSDAISKDLKRRGFKFVGSTTIYAHMQATGMVNDHLLQCDFR
ncbi:DNA-3-methyladenine glycosylase I [Flavobacterium sp.]|uniref:DNA-3-methyladenine glycosylase I n=1 Tax=Flavobacterium sp. TaxID=239 RepID=UPI00260F1AF4|nr:DNA-3-methyladenine glycosylase I [Flavobacterium sp.]